MPEHPSPPLSPLPSRSTYLATLIPVSPCSAASPCPICHDPYTPAHPPILLQPCGHIFGKPFILEWFKPGTNSFTSINGTDNGNEDIGRNTCPLDRQELFKIPKPLGLGLEDFGIDEHRYEDRRWSLVPFLPENGVTSTRGDLHGTRAARRDAVSQP